ncbi:dihydroneopterin aldolase [Sphingomonas sp. Leaf17]|uniref:dihydroneopterin aldolase n=1 Tax=Sphingomonas sp. Leaf17 TaxID=1735683 RepID=UPI000AF4B7B3|nr:dihydroneopterin aldolase [Sphingomonas sp. Leaf17]
MVEYTTILEAMQVAMRLGIHAHEQVPQRVQLSIRMTAVYATPPAEDAISAVVDYDFLRTGILALAQGPGFDLQESLCDAVAELCFRDDRVRTVTVQSMKLDVYPDARVGCEIVRSR